MMIILLLLLVFNSDAKKITRDTYDQQMRMYQEDKYIKTITPWGVLIGQNKYRGEPVDSPNKLTLILKCNDKDYPIIKTHPNCGLDNITWDKTQGKIFVHFKDYDGPTGLCLTKRKKTLKVPCQ